MSKHNGRGLYYTARAMAAVPRLGFLPTPKGEGILRRLNGER